MKACALLLLAFVLFFEGYQTTTATNNCPWRKFQCNNKKCIKHTFRCDNGDDCGDDSDETGCGERCTKNYYRCRNGKCVSRMHLCEGDDDCGDNSDETQELCGSGPAPLICYNCNSVGSSNCSKTVTCNREYTRCARLAYLQNGSNIIESTCATKSDCTSEGTIRECNKRGRDCKMQCCAKNRCNKPTAFDPDIVWSPHLACYQCNIHNWETCKTQVTCQGNEGYSRCFKISYNRIESGKELRVTSTGCATQSNCTGKNDLCVGKSNCKLQCCDNSSCNTPKSEETSSKTNLKCYKCSSTKSYQDCSDQKVLETCRDSEDRCYQAQVVTDYKNDDGVSRMFYKGCTLTSKCNGTTLEVCKKHIKVTSCKVKCCSKNACNAGSSLVVSGFFLMSCVILYLYTGLPV